MCARFPVDVEARISVFCCLCADAIVAPDCSSWFAAEAAFMDSVLGAKQGVEDMAIKT